MPRPPGKSFHWVGACALFALAPAACQESDDDDGSQTVAGSAGMGSGGSAGGARAGSAGSSSGGASGGSDSASAGNAGAAGTAGSRAGSGGRGGAAGSSGQAGTNPAGGSTDSQGGAAGDDASGAGGDDGGTGGGAEPLGPDAVFRASSRFTIIDPRDYGAEGDGTTDDAEALESAFDAVPDSGGIVLFPAGIFLKEQRSIRVTKSHTLLWAPNRRATIHGTVRSLTDEERAGDLCGVRQQAIVFRQTSGGGVYGLKFTSNATERTSCAEDCQLTLDTVNGMDVVGTEMDGAAACGVFAWSSQTDERSENLFVEGNFIHHTYADSVHHTHGARRSWCWDNYFFNEAPSLGDDGIACVTYSPSDPRCGEMEWWGNSYLGGAHGRGMAVIGGEDISIHHNWIVGSASAGLIVASESAYTSASSERIELFSNYLVNCPNGSVNNGHSAILVSGGNSEAEPIRDVEAIDNVIVGAPGGRVERAEGDYDAETVVFDNSTDAADLPGPVPTLEDVAIRDTSLLRTRDVSFVAATERKGLYRIHLREAAGDGLEERFEYIVRGTDAALTEWLGVVLAGGAYVSESRDVDGETYALVLAPVPLEVPLELDGVSFDTLRTGDRSGGLSWLWSRVDQGRY